MRRAAVIALTTTVGIVTLVPLAACGAESGGGASRSGARTSGSEERLERARREMGLREETSLAEAASRGRAEEDEDELPFALGAEHLPELPHDVDAEGGALREGLALARSALAMARPEPERDLDRPGFQTFVEEDYARWVAARAQALRTARAALAGAEGGELGEYVVASAVIGLLFVRFAEAIATMPLPAAIEASDADRLRFRDAFVRAAAPLFGRGADAFGACAAATVRSGDSTLGAWQRFCDERLERAQDAPRPIE